MIFFHYKVPMHSRYHFLYSELCKSRGEE
ncbi:hypothetical protein ABV523_12050 [Snodgrassella alvi]